MKRKAIQQGLSPERQHYLQAVKRRKNIIQAWRIGVLVAFIAAWQLAASTGAIDSFVFSSPARIVKTLGNMAQNQLAMHIGVTLYETLTGFVLGVVFGTVLATALWSSTLLSRIAEPYLVVLNSLPKIALGPVIIIVAGAGTKAIIVMALAISMIVTVLEMLAGFLSTDAELVRMAATFGANKRQIFFKVVLPANMGTLFNSLKINIGLSLVGVIAGEFLVSKAGLGYLIVYGGQVFQLDLVMASVIVLALLAAGMYQSVVVLQHLVQRRFGQ